jgi:hypothetical protein
MLHGRHLLSPGKSLQLLILYDICTKVVSNNGQDKSSKDKPTNGLKAYSNVLVSKGCIELADQYHAQAEVCDLYKFDMLVGNNFTGYGL